MRDVFIIRDGWMFIVMSDRIGLIKRDCCLINAVIAISVIFVVAFVLLIMIVTSSDYYCCYY